MPGMKIRVDEIEFIIKMKKLKYSNCEIARKLGVTEGAIRYRIKRHVSGRGDGRKEKASGLDRYFSLIKGWEEDYRGVYHRPAMKTLYERLQGDFGYKGSYDAFRRYLSKHFPEFRRKVARMRIETPPGAMVFVDWKEDVPVQMGKWGNWVKVQALCMSLGFSRKLVVQFCEKKDLKSFIHCHQEGFRALGGLPEMVRTDCLKSAVLRWKGSKSVLNERYERYMKRLGVEVFPSRPGVPENKGKLEKRIRDVFSRMDFKHQVYADMADLNQKAAEEVRKLESQWQSGATGRGVAESFGYEQKYLKSLPHHFPLLPLNERRTQVRNDGTVFFEGNYYQVKGAYRGHAVLCVNTGEEIVIYHEGDEIGRFGYLPKAQGMVRLSEEAINDSGVYLSTIVRQWALQVAARQVEMYQDIVGREGE
jgi:transposase